MLETINLLIGLAVVMLLVSFAVTLITQIIVGVFNLRGLALRLKVTNLLVLIDNGIHPKHAAHIAGLVLRNALIGRPGLPWITSLYQLTQPDDDPPNPTRQLKFGLRPAAVIHREELARLLLAFGKLPREYPVKWSWMFRTIDTDDLQTRMRESLKSNGVRSPEKALADMRRRTMELERDKPELSNSERANQALLDCVKSDFIGKLNGWFDQTVDRASDLFTGWTQLTAFLVALVVAVLLQLDSLSLINRLSTDRAARSKLVDWATQHVDKGPPKPGLETTVLSAAQSALGGNDLIPIAGPGQWLQRWSGPVPCPDSTAATAATTPPKQGEPEATKRESASVQAQATTCPLPRVSVLGVALSTILLSLGGPFWYSALSGLLKLRSTLAGKDDSQRNDRQTDTTPQPAAK
jgi:hypothetical protein